MMAMTTNNSTNVKPTRDGEDRNGWAFMDSTWESGLIKNSLQVFQSLKVVPETFEDNGKTVLWILLHNSFTIESRPCSPTGFRVRNGPLRIAWEITAPFPIREEE
jgi:hypothetical protein